MCLAGDQQHVAGVVCTSVHADAAAAVVVDTWSSYRCRNVLISVMSSDLFGWWLTCRCLHTASLVLDGIKPNATNVEEFVRETLGEDTCDARRSVSDPNSLTESKPQSPCSFDKGLASSYPKYKYRVYNPEDDADRSFGLLGDSDHLWTKDSRERQKHQVSPWLS